MQDIVQDPLARLIDTRMEEAIANGADVPELAALTIDAALASPAWVRPRHRGLNGPSGYVVIFFVVDVCDKRLVYWTPN